MKANIDQLNLIEAESILKSIKTEYPYINSVYQETFYYLLESYYYNKSNNRERAFEVFNNGYLPLIEGIDIEKLPVKMREIFFYMQAIISLYNKD